ncbi:IS701 family transposase, partial [Streptomyces cyaneofuscatus]|uniref:IS701 family transposase n=1 Tax=Streptomyces cyaneofuscatus TaxID=66883 RepID=UPI003494E0DB
WILVVNPSTRSFVVPQIRPTRDQRRQVGNDSGPLVVGVVISLSTPAIEEALLVPYPAMVDVSHELVEHVSWLLYEHRLTRNTRRRKFGFSKGWRTELERADVFHVMATTRHDTVVTRWAMDHPVHDLFPGLPRQKWKRRSCGNGAYGPRVYDWARVEVRPWHREDRRHWVIARRSVSRPDQISYYIAYCPADTTLDELIHVAGSRWAVEECFQTAKQECGLDDYQVRRYPGWHRHITLAMAAHACLTVLRARALDTEKAETDPPSSSP